MREEGHSGVGEHAAEGRAEAAVEVCEAGAGRDCLLEGGGWRGYGGTYG